MHSLLNILTICWVKEAYGIWTQLLKVRQLPGKKCSSETKNRCSNFFWMWCRFGNTCEIIGCGSIRHIWFWLMHDAGIQGFRHVFLNWNLLLSCTECFIKVILITRHLLKISIFSNDRQGDCCFLLWKETTCRCWVFHSVIDNLTRGSHLLFNFAVSVVN